MRKRLLNVCLSALVCMISMSAWALEKSGNAYQIGSAEDLRAFAELVNGGETLANAVLTADVKCATDQPAIGTDANRYAGVFDGQGHTITLDAYPMEKGCAVFRNLDYKGMVQNLVVDGQITTAFQNAAGIVAYNRGSIDRCVSKVEINSSVAGDGTHGGITAIQYMGAVMTNCLAAGKISGDLTTNCGGLAGWLDGRSVLENNISVCEITIAADPADTHDLARNTGNIKVGRNLYLEAKRLPATTDSEGIAISEEWMKNGTACFFLNSDQSDVVWTQTLGEDEYPVPFKTRGQVYAKSAVPCIGFAEGTEFTNNAGEAVACQKHNMVAGKCQNTFFNEEEGEDVPCGYWNPYFVQRDAERYLMLKNAEDMEWYAEYHLNGGEYASSRLVADIDYTGHDTWISANWFSGEFDGQGHTITIAFPDRHIEGDAVDASGTNNALFPQVGGGTIKNLKVTGTIETSAKYASGLVGHTMNGTTYTSYIQNCVTDVTITSTLSGDGTHGGLIAVTDGLAYVDNSIALGTITSPDHITTCCGGLIGWTSTTSYLTNCAFLGVLDVNPEGSDVITRNNGSSSITNTYYLNDAVEPMTIPGPAIQTTADAVSSGKLAYLLNNNNPDGTFRQTIGTDAIPMPFGTSQKVYASPSDGFRCDGVPQGNVTYTNSESSVQIPPHTFNGAFCEVCGYFNAEYKQPNADGVYELANAKDFVWFSQKVNRENAGNLNAILTADIEMEDEDNELFQPIGSTSNLYKGTFDGQNHTISGLVIETNGAQYTGVFGCVGGGVVIKNFTLDATCSISGGAFTGLVGGSNGSGEVRMLQLGNEGTVTSTAQNAGGIYGCNMESAATPIIENCYVTGAVVGANESGQISGWAASGQVRNCWSIAELTGVDGSNWMFRGSPTSENNYSTLGQVNGLSEEDLATGALTWKLNNEKFANVVWYQNVGEDEHPVLNPNHGVVYSFGGELGCVIGGDISGLRGAMVTAETDWIQNPDMSAEKALKESYEEQVQGLAEANSLESLMSLYEALLEAKKTVQTSVDAYAKYKAKVDEMLRYLAEHSDFEGPDREFLQDYLESGDEPNEDNPNGGAEYILEYELLTAEEITAETARIDELLRIAVANGYIPGTEVTSFILNADFRDGFNNWEGVKGTGAKAVELGDEGLTYYGGESWSTNPMDMYQTITLPKKGYYLYMMNAAYRPANDRYSYSHAAKIYANGVGVVVPTTRESMIPADEAIDQVNANLHSGDVEDLAILADPTDGESEVIGYGLHGQRSMAIAVYSNRVINHTVAEVGEDGQLTVGISNPHGYHTTSEEWTGFANSRLVFLGEDLEAAEAQSGLDASLQDDVDRATTILTLYQFSDGTDFAHAPNYSEALKTELQGLVNEAGNAQSGTQKYELIKKFSDIFDRIYDCRMAYSAMFAKAEALAGVSADMVSMLGEELALAMSNAAFGAFEAYNSGEYTAEQARNAMNDFDVMPEKVDGVYQIANGIQLAIFAANVNSGENTAKAVLIDDIDMGGKLLDDGTPDYDATIFNPIGTPTYVFKGTLDGQGHKISNLVVDGGSDLSGTVGGSGVANSFAGLIGVIGGGAVVKNFILDSSCYIHGGAFTGIIGGSSGEGTVTMEQLGNEGTVLADAQNAGGIIGVNMNSSATFVINNCYATGRVAGGRESGAITGWSGGAQSSITNCWSTAEVSGNDSGKPFYRHDSTVTSNNYNQYGQQANSISDNDLKSGKLTYNLNQGETENPVWFQNLAEEGGDPHPMLFGTDIVYLYQSKYTNEKPTIELNSYAYGIETASSADNVTVTYALNANAQAAKINFKKGDEVVYTQELAGDELSMGKHSVTVENSNLPEAGTELTYDIEVTSFGVAEAFRIKAPTESGTYSFWRPYSIAVNTNPESKRFGDMYVTESGYDNTTTSGYHSDKRHNGLFAFDPEFKAIEAEDGIPGFQGGLDMQTAGIQVLDGTEAFEPKSVEFTRDGRLFVSLMGGKTNSPVWEANPDDLDEAWTPLFVGGETDTETGVTWIGDEIQAGMMADITTSGAGENLKLWTLACGRSNGGANVTDYFAYTYDLGTKKQWDTTPSGQVDVLMNQWTIAPGGVQIAADNQGGLWYVQYRANPTEEVPALKHINAEGKVDYNSPTVVLPGAGIAVNRDGSWVAIVSASGQVTVYNVSYVPNPNGLIMPAPKYTVNTQESRITCLAFDYAGNLYAGSPSTETVNRYVLPSWTNNVTVTPAPSAAAFKVGATGIESIAEGAENGEIYTIGGVRVQKAQKGVNIINGKKVLTK